MAHLMAAPTMLPPMVAPAPQVAEMSTVPPPFHGPLMLSHGIDCTPLDQPPPAPLPSWCASLHTEMGVVPVLPNACCVVCAHAGHQIDQCPFRGLQRRCWGVARTSHGDVALVRVAQRTRVRYLAGADVPEGSAEGWHQMPVWAPTSAPTLLERLPSELVHSAEQCAAPTTTPDGQWK
jgi:hypothetical protein